MNAIDALVLMDTALFGGAKVVFVLELQNYFFWKIRIKISSNVKNVGAGRDPVLCT
jgi:hypothetical protein